MGREVRRVPAGWEHPRQDIAVFGAVPGKRMPYQPMFDQAFETRAREWLDEAIAWDNGSHPECRNSRGKKKHPFYWTYAGNPPNKEYYRPKWTAEEMTHYQVYETVSEGTPTSPVFATEEALIDWLVNDGGRDGKHSRKAAEAFVKNAWAPSMTISAAGIKTGVDVYDK